MRKTLKEGVNTQLREERVRRHWSQQNLADLIGTTPNTISRWELGLSSIGPYFRARLCQLFNKTEEALGFLSEAPEASTAEGMFADPAVPAFQRPIGRDELLKHLSQQLSGRPAVPFWRCMACLAWAKRL